MQGIKIEFRAVLFLLSSFLTVIPGSIYNAYANIESNEELGVFPPDSRPYGLTYSEWSAKWWQWLYSNTQERSPATDTTGEFCGENQNNPNVWFLAGTTGGSITRSCTIPSGRSIFLPAINVACDFTNDPSLKTEADLRTCAKADQDNVKQKQIVLDGVELTDLEAYRVQSPLFELKYPEENIAGVEPQTTKAISDGTWVMIRPLPVGEHEIRFLGVIGDPTSTTNFVSDVKLLFRVSEASSQNSSGPLRLEGFSTSGDFKLQVNWTSADIGSENTFEIKMMEANGQWLRGATYDVMLFEGNQRLDETHRANQTGTQQKYTFEEAGSYILRIENINGSGNNDGISIPIQVTPEFPMGIFGLMAASIGAIFVTSKSVRRLIR